jgi:hypothetical protein
MQHIGVFLTLVGGLVFMTITLLVLANIVTKLTDWLYEKKRKLSNIRGFFGVLMWGFIVLVFAIVFIFCEFLGYLMSFLDTYKDYCAYLDKKSVLNLHQKIHLKLRSIYRKTRQYWLVIYLVSGSASVLGYQLM